MKPARKQRTREEWCLFSPIASCLWRPNRYSRLYIYIYIYTFNYTPLSIYIQAAGAIHSDFTKNFEQAEIWWTTPCLHCAVQPFFLPALYSFVDNPQTWAKESGRDASFCFIDNASRFGVVCQVLRWPLATWKQNCVPPLQLPLGRSSQKVIGWS